MSVVTATVPLSSRGVRYANWGITSRSFPASALLLVMAFGVGRVSALSQRLRQSVVPVLREGKAADILRVSAARSHHRYPSDEGGLAFWIVPPFDVVIRAAFEHRLHSSRESDIRAQRKECVSDWCRFRHRDAAIAETFARAGAHVFVTDVKLATASETAGAHRAARGARRRRSNLDVRDEAACAERVVRPGHSTFW